MEKKWLSWAKQLQAIAQCGLEYSKDKFDIERFEQIRQISVDIIGEYTDMDDEKVRNLFASESGYQTPKVDVRAAVFKGDEILLVKEQSDQRWSLPGGWADIDYSVKENIIKEAWEEAGVEVKPKRIIAIHDRNRRAQDTYPYSVYKIFVECDYLNGEHQDNIETSDSGFFRMDALPELSHTRNTIEQVKMCFEARGKEVFNVEFD